MNLDAGIIDQALNAIPFPVSKNNLIDLARQKGANDQIVSVLQRLPNKTFNSAQDVKDALGSLGGLFSR